MTPSVSAPVYTATTPGCDAAPLASMDVMFAWAWGLRRIAAWTIPGSLMSSV